MLTAILIGFFAISAFVSMILVAACVLSGRAQESQTCEGVEAAAIAEVQLPRRLRTSLSSQ